jgi:two-component system, OmpR family, response regulator
MARLLVVDDEQRICRFIARSLTARGDRVDTAPDGASALHLANVNDYDLVILDLLLPDIDGYEVLRRLLEQDSSQRILVLSAISEVDSRVRCLRLGAVDFMSKPFSTTELIERVKLRTEDHSATFMPRWIDAGGLRLDLERRMLKDGRREITLSPREFVLLEHLMRRANEVCTRTELLDRVWGYSFDPGSNVVDVCVRRLRSKLGDEQIETIRNVGYCFVAS